MPVELRKRPAPAAVAPPPAKKAAPAKSKPAAKEAPAPKAAAAKSVAPKAAAAAPKPAAESTKSKAPSVGDSITLEGFGGEVSTQDGETTTLAKLVADSKAGVVLFTYPAANTPGCTKQACLFRDFYEPLTATGLSIYGLSKDSPKSNTTFKTKQKLPYPLLCDPELSLIKAIGLLKAPKSTTRGVFVVSKDGKVLAAEPGGPEPTVNVVKKLVASMDGAEEAKSADDKEPAEDAKEAEEAEKAEA